MNLFDEILRRSELLAARARAIIKADLEAKRIGIPGKAFWNGYNAKGIATVKKNGQIFPVKTTSTINIPIGTEVYVDETFTVEYKSNNIKEKKKQTTAPEPKDLRRVKKVRKPVLGKPLVTEDVRGACWLVYHEYLRELDWTTASGVQTNPSFAGYSLFLGIVGLITLGGGVLAGLIFWTLFEQKFEILFVPLDTIVEPSDNTSLPDGYEGNEWTYFAIIQAALDHYQGGNFGFMPLDGVFIGINTALSNTITFIGNHLGLQFTYKFFLRPWTINFNSDKINALLTHFGPYKIQALIIRAVGVYPPKKFKINFHSWGVPEDDISDFVPTNDYQEWLDDLPPMKYGQFVIPDNITEWNTILGNGLTNSSNTVADIIPYELIPFHEYYSFGDEAALQDPTKFVSYSGDSVFLNYVLKAYAPWTDLDDSLRINYYMLTIRAQNPAGSNNIEFSYKLSPSTFNLPPELIVLGQITVEDPQFPIQAGERNVAEMKITYTIQGTNDPAEFPGPVIINAVKGEAEKRGLLTGVDVDSSPITRDPVTNIAQYIPGQSLTFNLSGQQIDGLVINSNTGEYIFDPNVSEYSSFGPGTVLQLFTEYTITEPGGGGATGIIQINYVGSNSSLVNPNPSPPPAKAISGNTSTTPAPIQVWDPPPILESNATGQEQIFNKIEVSIPLPEQDDEGNVLGWQGRVARVELQEISAPEIRLVVGENTYSNPFLVTASDFIFSAVTDATRFGNAKNVLTDFTIKKNNYDFLGPNMQLKITYTIKGLVNNAPFVGNFEDLSTFQQRKLRSDMVRFAFGEDWRSKIYNARTETSPNSMFHEVLGDSPTRDEDIPLLNIDESTRTVSTDFFYEFDWYDETITNPKQLLDGNHSLQNPEDAVVYMTGSFLYEYDTAAKELLFYLPQNGEKGEPLDYESLMEILRQNGQAVRVKDYWRWDMLPSHTDRADVTGAKWRVDRDNSATKKAYLIFGFLGR